MVCDGLANDEDPLVSYRCGVDLINVTQHAPCRRVMLLSHIYNEAMLLPHFIRAHAPLFDHALIIDYNSTDNS